MFDLATERRAPRLTSSPWRRRRCDAGVTDRDLNGLWCRALAEELRRSGVCRAVLCPGSRNSPLLFALAAAFGDDAVSHVDERSGAFIALGATRLIGAPTLVCVTSGSALANCAPALAEAQGAHLPLIVVVADRPWELHGCGAPQTMPQVQVLRGLVGRECDLGEPVASDRALRALRSQVSRLAQGSGPAVINVPLRDPLVPTGSWTVPEGMSDSAVNGRKKPGEPAPFTRLGVSAPVLGRRGLITAGHGAVADRVLHLAEMTGYPVLADAISGLRRDDVPRLICHADALVSGPLGRERPDTIIQCGDVPLSRAVYEWLDRAEATWISDEPDGRNRDWLARAGTVLNSSRRLPQSHGVDAAWISAWQSADSHANQALVAAMADSPWSEPLAAHLICRHPAPRRLLVANSMAVRHANLHCGPRPKDFQLFANRGVNGIDGQVGTLIGLASTGAPGPTWLLTGDLALLHDLPALAGLAKVKGPGAIIVLNNGGGGIFDYLPVASEPGYQQWVRTAHGLDFTNVAAQFGLTYHRVADRAGLNAALAAASVDQAGWRLIECDLRSATDTVERHRALVRAMAGMG